ncbi:MAG: single-stranded DNA-binding protein [Propionibacteriaceae bacterium]|jgi:single-strand DNA-binding protein|nr:single-stranded DNA-binding protein [Propionibacteriaceae bacterium]
MESRIWLTGRVGGEVTMRKVSEKYSCAEFRLGCTPRFKGSEGWANLQTIWVTVECAFALGVFVGQCVNKGDPVFVAGELRVQRWNTPDGQAHELLRVKADVVGHDLNYGRSAFERVKHTGPDGLADSRPEAQVGEPGASAEPEPITEAAGDPEAPEREQGSAMAGV